MDPQTIDLTQLFYILLFLLGGVLVIAMLLLGWVIWSVRRINLPPNADFFTTLRATPFIVVLVLDLLDLSLDFLSAPIAWVLLSYLGLTPLRAVATVETLIPGTQFLPTMTTAWIIARFVKRA
jgi:uncharacterized iron-regulated membrane protein